MASKKNTAALTVLRDFLSGGNMSETDKPDEAVDALCKECGHAFKSYIDRILPNEDDTGDGSKVECPVCGCSDCKIGH